MIGVNRIYHSGSDELATVCGFQEMPSWSIDPLALEHLRNEALMLLTEYKTMNSSLNDGLPHVGSTAFINGS